MRKILILVDKVGKKKELLAELVSRRLAKGNFQIALARFSDLYFEIDGKNILIEVEGEPIENFDLVYFRRAGENFGVIAGTLALCLKQLEIRFIDSAWSQLGPLGSKFTSLVRLSLAGLPVFPTVYIWPTNLEKYRDRIIKKFGFPLVAKELSMQRGKGVFKIESKEDFLKLPLKDRNGKGNQFMFQRFVKIKDEYRLLVLGSSVGVWEKKKITSPGEFRHNIALGGKEEFLPIAKIPQNISSVAILGSKALNLQISGVDIAVEKGTDKVWLVEVNRGPGFTYDTKISPEIHELADYLAKESNT